MGQRFPGNGHWIKTASGWSPAVKVTAPRRRLPGAVVTVIQLLVLALGVLATVLGYLHAV